MYFFCPSCKSLERPPLPHVAYKLNVMAVICFECMSEWSVDETEFFLTEELALRHRKKLAKRASDSVDKEASGEPQ